MIQALSQKQSLDTVYFMIIRRDERIPNEMFYIGSINTNILKSITDILEDIFVENNKGKDKPIVLVDEIGKEYRNTRTSLTGWTVDFIKDYVLVYIPRTNRIIYAICEPFGWTILYDSALEEYYKTLPSTIKRQYMKNYEKAMKYLKIMKKYINKTD